MLPERLFAAAAAAQLTGRLTVCAGSCGPGNTTAMHEFHFALIVVGRRGLVNRSRSPLSTLVH
jgi:hypothetical protein